MLGELGVSPVLTAHPTEVRRKTVLDALGRIADLLDERGRLERAAPERDDLEDALRLEVLMLWQTAILRLSKLRVRDEINESLRYYDTSLFEVVPALQRDIEREFRRATGASRSQLGPVIAMGSWIGGDRDGNPFVTAEVMRLATTAPGRRWPSATTSPPCTGCRVELSMSSRLVTPTAALEDAGRAVRRRRRRSGSTSPTGGRCAACTPGSTPSPPASSTRCRGRLPHAALEPYALHRRAAGRPRHRGRLAARRTGRGRWRTPTSMPVRRAVADVRRPPLRARHAPELGRARGGHRRPLRRGRTGIDYLALDEADAGRAADRGAAFGPPAAQPLGRSTATPPAASSRCSTRSPSAVRRHGAEDRAALRDLHGRVGERRARGRRAAQGGRPAGARRRAPTSTSTSSRCSRRSTTCSEAPPTLAALLALPRLPLARRRSRRLAGGDDRLLRLQQGRWLPHLDLVAVPGPDRAGPASRTTPACGCGCSTVGAARSDAAAGRPTRRSSPNRSGSVDGALRITEQGEIVAAKYSHPASARRNLETLAAATLAASLDRGAAAGRRATATARP